MTYEDIEELEELLATAAGRGARQALAAMGLHDEGAADDIRDLRGLLTAWRQAKSAAWQTAVRTAVTAFLALLVTGLAVKLKMFGGQG